MLTDARKAELLRLARESMTAQVLGRTPATAEQPLEVADASGVFVTIKRRGELRGCLGTLECRGSLAEDVARCARDSASRDPRFPPITRGELPDLSIEISVLGPLELVDPEQPGAVVIGRHGLVVEVGSSRGLLLPQVAGERSWTVGEFLEHTCRKAGLPPHAWKHGARVFRFDADVFGD
ncbi:MAG TPA: AmmeMemoRadiSam system protein A [Vicinamibacterales bacterium]|nr:AmmeMemoRadiSam system protein A [Vicinamibacterales bacterium]